MSVQPPRQRESFFLLGIFIAALLAHGWLATRNWTAGFMPGHEFRQTQTAITAYYIDQQNNFSLLYEAPILGKPWVSILMEVPLYEWCVVGLSRATGLPHILAARTVSLACFYLMLPALYLLLGRYQLVRPQRLLVLALVLTSPVYLFYSRAFLMESMELMCCAWFLYGFVQMMDRRRWYWFLVAAVAGTGAALIKSVTLAVWLIPAAGYGAWRLWQDLRDRKGWGAAAETVFWNLAGVIVPLGALRLWIDLTDPLKAAHASAWIFTSKNLSQGNWGLFDPRPLFSAELWRHLFFCWEQAIMSRWLIALGLVAGLALPTVRWRILGMAGVFFLAQFLFPHAYADQDYYFYACTVFLLAALGFLLVGLLESKVPRWGCWLAVAVFLGAPLDAYRRDYFPQQLVRSGGGFAFTEVLRDFTPKESVIIVAGSDWSAIIPFYTQHKALMIRNGLENDPAYLDRALGDLADEDVAALVMTYDQRRNRSLIEQVTRRFELDPTPTFSQGTADIYCNRQYTARVRKNLMERRNYGGDITTNGPVTPPAMSPREPIRILSAMAGTTFAMVSPAPIRAHFTQGIDHLLVDGRHTLFAHPDSNLWLHAPVHASRIEWEFGLLSGSYEKAGDKTDGVEFSVMGLMGGNQRLIFRRVLDPVSRAADRGTQRENILYQGLPGELLLFTSRPVHSYAYDWAYWAKIDVK